MSPTATDLDDGLWAVIHDRYGVCAGFIVAGGRVVEAAPILRRRLSWWIANSRLHWVGP